MAWYKYFSVEVPFFLCAFSFVLQGVILTNLYVYRTCYVLLKFDESQCSQLGNEDNNVTAWLEPKVQPTVNHITMVHNVIQSLLPMAFCLFVGSWSDKFGRKPFMLLCLTGICLTTGLNTIIVFFENASPWFFILTTIPSLLTGGFTTLMMVFSTFLADVTTEKDRVIRYGIYDVIFASSSVLGNLVSSYLFYATSYETVYLLCTGLTILSLVYTILFIPESLKHAKKVFSFRELMRSINLKTIFKEVVKKRENNSGLYILTLMLVNVIFGLGVGEISVTTLFLRAKLRWTLTKISLVNSITSFGNIMGTLFGTYVLYRILKIRELQLCIFGISLLSIANILRALATNDYYIYTANIFNVFFGLPLLMLRTIMTFILAPEEMGKFFALMSIIMSVDSLISGLIYPEIYNATLDFNSGLYNFISFGIHAVTGIVIIFLTRVPIPHYKPQKKEGQNNEENGKSKKISISVNNFEVLGIFEKRSSKRFSLEMVDTRKLSLTPSVF